MIPRIRSRRWARFSGYLVSVSDKLKRRPYASLNIPAAATTCGAFWKTDLSFSTLAWLLHIWQARVPLLVKNPYGCTTWAVAENCHHSSSNLVELCPCL